MIGRAKKALAAAALALAAAGALALVLLPRRPRASWMRVSAYSADGSMIWEWEGEAGARVDRDGATIFHGGGGRTTITGGTVIIEEGGGL